MCEGAVLYVVSVHPCSFLQLFIESIDYMKKSIAGSNIIPCFHTALGIDSITHIREIIEDVESIKHERKIAFHETFTKTCIPD
jgi:hypothetical protein